MLFYQEKGLHSSPIFILKAEGAIPYCLSFSHLCGDFVLSGEGRGFGVGGVVCFEETEERVWGECLI